MITLIAEAVDAIVTYSHTASQLLRRKKVKREHIYQYLAENGVIEPVTSDKPSLIRRAMLYWGSPQQVGCSFLMCQVGTFGYLYSQIHQTTALSQIQW